MQTLGIIGGVSWYSTAEYYRRINQKITQVLGLPHSARLMIATVDFADLLLWQKDSSMHLLREAFLAEGCKLKSAGCEAFIIASHTLSWLGTIIESDIGIKHISLYDAVFQKLKSLDAQRVGLTGTRYTMKDYRFRELYEKAGFEVCIPREPHQQRTAHIVYKELVHGVFLQESKLAFGACFDDLEEQKVDAIVLGCTEIGLLVRESEWPARHSQNKSAVPLVDLIEAHVNAAVSWMLRAKSIE